jgi:hypothetical protein
LESARISYEPATQVSARLGVMVICETVTLPSVASAASAVQPAVAPADVT